jgi:molybdopterin/thiamine biosynthesis adenylyltransferase
MNLINHSRFSSAPWYGVKKEIVVGGAGGIGSWLTLMLTRIGHQIYLYDNDNIDTTNMAGQLYTYESIGKSKVSAIKEICSDFNNYDNVIAMNELYDDGSMGAHVMMSCFDNMDARKTMFDEWLSIQDAIENPVFIDGRMTAEQGQVFCVHNEETIEKYKEHLFESDEAEELPCSFKATSHNGAMIASRMVAVLNNFIANKREGMDMRTVPFYQMYELSLFTEQIEV